MNRTDVLIIGGGQAGLAISHCLKDRGVDHVILERGRVGERWRSERWDSLRMLTPRWQSRLPGWSYDGPNADGFMSKGELIDYLDAYARSFDAPIRTGVTVDAVDRAPNGFRVQTDKGVWHAGNVVAATGHCDRPYVPAFATDLSPEIEQVVTTRYRNPSQLQSGGVMVVGASATGIQLATEIAASGREVTLCVRRHNRLPRSYRGRDILYWLDAMGVLTEDMLNVWDIHASRSQPSLQLTGSDDHKTLDLDTAHRAGVRIVGSVIGIRDERVFIADDLQASIDRAQRKMNELLDKVDAYIERSGLSGVAAAPDRPGDVTVPVSPRCIDLKAKNISTVLWATGYRRDYSWLRLPVLDENGELSHDGGVTLEPGLYAVGLNFMRRRNSSFIDGVGADAAEIADHITARIQSQATDVSVDQRQRRVS